MGGEREESNGLVRELITWQEELLEELCFEFSEGRLLFSSNMEEIFSLLPFVLF